jgi:hypothetical protein
MNSRFKSDKMSREQFKQTLESLENQYRHAEIMRTIYKGFLREDLLDDIENIHHWSSNQLIALMQEQMNDTEIAIDGYTWIEWWISENKFGLNGLEAKINGVVIKNADDLYDALMGGGSKRAITNEIQKL